MSWIKIDRDIQKHWIWDDPIKLKWWLDILITVNFEDKKTSIGFKLFECKRGESVMSLLSWSNRWNVSKSVVNNFFRMLEQDGMINIINETVTTRLIVCNYDSYQLIENAKKTQGKRLTIAKKTQGNPTKEGEEGKENIVVGWRESYEVYISDLRKIYKEIINDNLYIQERQKFNPSLNILLSIEKACVEFWSTEAGWKHKKKSKSIELDWKDTFTKSLAQTQNKVYLNKNNQNGNTRRDLSEINHGTAKKLADM